VASLAETDPTREAYISRMHQTTKREGRYRPLLLHTHRLPSVPWCRSLCQKWGLFLVKPQVKSQRTVLVESQQMLAVIKRVVDNNIICLSATQLIYTYTMQCCCSIAAAENSQLHFSW